MQRTNTICQAFIIGPIPQLVKMKIHWPQHFTDTLVPAPEEPEEEGKKKMEVDTKGTPDMDLETDMILMTQGTF